MFKKLKDNQKIIIIAIVFFLLGMMIHTPKASAAFGFDAAALMPILTSILSAIGSSATAVIGAVNSGFSFMNKAIGGKIGLLRDKLGNDNEQLYKLYQQMRWGKENAIPFIGDKIAGSTAIKSVKNVYNTYKKYRRLVGNLNYKYYSYKNLITKYSSQLSKVGVKDLQRLGKVFDGTDNTHPNLSSENRKIYHLSAQKNVVDHALNDVVKYYGPSFTNGLNKKESLHGTKAKIEIYKKMKDNAHETWEVLLDDSNNFSDRDVLKAKSQTDLLMVSLLFEIYQMNVLKNRHEILTNQSLYISDLYQRIDDLKLDDATLKQIMNK